MTVSIICLLDGLLKEVAANNLACKLCCFPRNVDRGEKPARLRGSTVHPVANSSNKERPQMLPKEVQPRSRHDLGESPGNSVTRWISALKQGNQAGAQGLWEAYYRRLVGLAHARLRDAPRRVADEEDVALSAFHSFWRGALAGRFPHLDDRNDLWQILVLITVRKAIDLRNHEGRTSRGSGKVRSLDGTEPGRSGGDRWR